MQDRQLQKIIIFVEEPTPYKIALAVASLRDKLVVTIRFEIFEYKKAVSKNLVFKGEEVLHDTQAFYANHILGAYKYYPPQITRIAIHAYCSGVYPNYIAAANSSDDESS
jgi:hypothetical protein